MEIINGFKFHFKKAGYFFIDNGLFGNSKFILHKSFYKKINAFKEIEKLKNGVYLNGIKYKKLNTPNLKKYLDCKNELKTEQFFVNKNKIFLNSNINKNCRHNLQLEQINNNKKHIYIDIYFYELIVNADKIQKINKDNRLILYHNKKRVGVLFGDKELSLKKFKDEMHII